MDFVIQPLEAGMDLDLNEVENDGCTVNTVKQCGCIINEVAGCGCSKS